MEDKYGRGLYFFKNDMVLKNVFFYDLLIYVFGRK